MKGQVKKKVLSELRKLEEENKENPEPLKALKEISRENLIEEVECQVLRAIYGMTRASNDSTPFEDFFRRVMGQTAYVLFTFDKTLNLTWKSLSIIQADDASQKSFTQFQAYRNESETKYYMFQNMKTPFCRFLYSPETRIFSIHMIHYPDLLEDKKTMDMREDYFEDFEEPTL